MQGYREIAERLFGPEKAKEMEKDLIEAFSQEIRREQPVNKSFIQAWLKGYPERRESLGEFMSGFPDHVNGRMELRGFERAMASIALKKHGIDGDGKADALVDALRDAGLIRERIECGAFSDYMDGLFRSRRHGRHSVASSHGTAECDRNGLVIALSGDWERIFKDPADDDDRATAIPLKFDLAEYREYWKEDLPRNFDILDLGFAGHSGIIEPPAMDWREDIKRELKAEEDAGKARPEKAQRQRM